MQPQGSRSRACTARPGHRSTPSAGCDVGSGGMSETGFRRSRTQNSVACNRLPVPPRATPRHIKTFQGARCAWQAYLTIAGGVRHPKRLLLLKVPRSLYDGGVPQRLAQQSHMRLWRQPRHKPPRHYSVQVCARIRRRGARPQLRGPRARQRGVVSSRGCVAQPEEVEELLLPPVRTGYEILITGEPHVRASALQLHRGIECLAHLGKDLGGDGRGGGAGGATGWD